MRLSNLKVLSGFSLFAMTTPCLLANENSSLSLNIPQVFAQKRSAWSQLNYYSPTEGYHSKGSFGLHLGLGALAPNTSAPQEGLSDEAREEIKETRPRLFLSKGTTWPIDFGLSFSILQSSKKAVQGGAHIQWTVSEGFQLPSIAFRASRSMLGNYQEVKSLTTDGLELGVSYAIVRYVIVSASVKQQWENGKTQARGDFLSLVDTDLPSWSDTKTIYSWGLNISPFTPFVQIGLEQSYWDNESQVSLGKLSFLL